MDTPKNASRFVLTFTAPQQLFAEIKADPGYFWWAPLGVISLVMTIGSLSFLGRVDWTSLMENQFAETGQNIPAEAMDQAISIGTTIGKIQIVAGGLIGPILIYLVMAGIFCLLINLSKRPVSFMQCLALYAWTDLVNLPRMLVSSIAGLRFETVTSVREFSTLDPGGALFYLPGQVADLSQRAFALYSLLNLFTLVHLVFIGYGISAITGMKKGRAILLALSPMLLVTAYKLFKAFFFMS